MSVRALPRTAELLGWWKEKSKAAARRKMGSGTAGVACQQIERNFIGIEKDAAIYRTACQRMGIKQERAA